MSNFGKKLDNLLEILGLTESDIKIFSSEIKKLIDDELINHKYRCLYRYDHPEYADKVQVQKRVVKSLRQQQSRELGRKK